MGAEIHTPEGVVLVLPAGALLASIRVRFWRCRLWKSMPSSPDRLVSIVSKRRHSRTSEPAAIIASTFASAATPVRLWAQSSSRFLFQLLETVSLQVVPGQRFDHLLCVGDGRVSHLSLLPNITVPSSSHEKTWCKAHDCRLAMAASEMTVPQPFATPEERFVVIQSPH